jgi:membrane protein YdbS with pleckstrin-like domain
MNQGPPRADRHAEAWRRFRRLMLLMLVASALVLALALAWLAATGTPLPWPFVAAVAVAVVGSMMLAAALMGLVFFSNASGADSAPEEPRHR